MVVTDSVLSGNVVVDNSGGILLTDEFSPTAHNTVENSTVNTTPSTVASRSPGIPVPGS